MWKEIEEAYALGYRGFFDKYGDRRLANLFLLATPTEVVLLVIAYLIFCLKLGPYLMKNREPFQLKNVLLLYNVFNIAFNAWLIREALKAGFGSYNFFCQPVDYSDNPDAVAMAFTAYAGMYVKLAELLDTVFFVLRKKFNQVTFLHVYHHAFMPLFSWLIVKFFAGGHTTFPSVLNSCVHVVMYSYYLLAGLGPGVQKYLWWKKYITWMQLIQFIIMFFHQSQVFFTDCQVSKVIPWIGSVHAFFFFCLFVWFYFKTYNAKKTKKT